MAKKSIVFVCLGNICRSPMAEAIFIDLLKKSGRIDEWVVDSAAILDIHVGKTPHPRTIDTLKDHGIKDYTHRVRQATSGDFERFDYVMGMDQSNISDLIDIERDARYEKKKATLYLLGSFDPMVQLNVIDPYYHDEPGAFEMAYEHIHRALQGFLERTYRYE